MLDTVLRTFSQATHRNTAPGFHTEVFNTFSIITRITPDEAAANVCAKPILEAHSQRTAT